MIEFKLADDHKTDIKPSARMKNQMMAKLAKIKNTFWSIPWESLCTFNNIMYQEGRKESEIYVYIIHWFMHCLYIVCLCFAWSCTIYICVPILYRFTENILQFSSYISQHAIGQCHNCKNFSGENIKADTSGFHIILMRIFWMSMSWKFLIPVLLKRNVINLVWSCSNPFLKPTSTRQWG